MRASHNFLFSPVVWTQLPGVFSAYSTPFSYSTTTDGAVVYINPQLPKSKCMDMCVFISIRCIIKAVSTSSNPVLAKIVIMEELNHVEGQ